MKTTVLDYYKKFHCTGGNCRHSCCTGWEIDIDKKTYDFYKQISGKFGKRLNDGIQITGKDISFRLTENEKCPFLNQNNLCDIYIELGEEHLCQVCSDHPRFRNYFSDRTEIGLGLCCESAGQLILGNKEKVKETVLKDDGFLEKLSNNERAVLSVRKHFFEILQNRESTIETRINKILTTIGIKFPDITIVKWADVYLNLECLDIAWQDWLFKLKATGNNNTYLTDNTFDVPFEQLIIYFLYRHLPDAASKEDIALRTLFSILSYKIISSLCALKRLQTGTLSLADIVEFSRLYSSEIEYSTENIDALLKKIKEFQNEDS